MIELPFRRFYFKSSGLKDTDKEALYSELLSLLSSGLDFSNSFGLLIAGENVPGKRKILEGLYCRVVAGSTLWQAMEAAGTFSSLDFGVVRIGEETGKLPDSLGFLAGYYHKKTSQKRIVTSATTYPFIILVTALLVVIFMMSFIVPMFEQVYSRMGSELPAMTDLIIRLSRRMPAILTILFIFTGAALFIIYMLKDSPGYKKISSSLLLSVPVAGDIIRKNNQAHICKLLYLLTASGVPLLSGLGMLCQIIDFYPYRYSLKLIAGGIEKGELLSENLQKFDKLYDRKLVTMIRVGEETNRLPQMLDKLSEDIGSALEHKLKQLGSLLEPVMILFVGLIVAVILISMYLPMFKLGGVVG
ncbi:MAG: type II secretion system F family protein [Alistipes sp.]|nr:type II secretion system F family protein [Alistipes sp.]